MSLSFMDAVHGCKKDIRVQMQTECTRCSGKKAEPGSTLKQCPKCNGTGEENVSTGFFNMRSTCMKCKGHGTFISDPCRSCKGNGAVLENQTITIPVPAGIEEGQTVRCPVQYGEVFVTFKVASSKIFQRVGADVITDVFISFAQGILGGSIKTPGLNGDIDLTIQPGTQSHQQMRLIGRGVPHLNGHGKGDHYINIKIHLPKYLTKRQKDLIVAFAESDDSISGSVNGVIHGEPVAKDQSQATNEKENESKAQKSKWSSRFR